MIPLSLAEVAHAVGGTFVDGADPSAVVSGAVVVDSRLAGPDGLFVAVVGERTDGHQHAGAAIEAGAVGVLAARPVGVPAIVVDDPVAALGRLAHEVAGRTTATVVALTGSSGKTSTKDLLAQVLETAGPTVAPEGSFNNEIGVPLTVLSVDDRTRHLVLEMGARGRGHIAALCRIAQPRVSAVLNVGSAHAGEFGGREQIAAAKQEIVETLPAGTDGGVAVLNADDPLVAAMAGVTSARVVRFGLTSGVDVRAEGVVLDGRGCAGFTLVTPEGAAPTQLGLHGAHHVSNALAAAAVARELGLDVTQVAGALQAARPRSPWRMEVVDRADGVTVVNDAYNANPESVAAALEALVALAGDRRTWAVLGEMLELGAASPDEHRAVGRLAGRLGVDRVVAVGDGARPIGDGATEAGTTREEPVQVADVEAAGAMLAAELRPGDVVLVKASRAAGLERVAAALLADDASPGGGP